MYEEIQKKLELRDYSALSPSDWTFLLKGLMRQEKEHACAASGKKMDSALVKSFPSIGASIWLHLNMRIVNEDGEVLAAIVTLSHFGQTEKQAIGEAFSGIIFELLRSREPDRDEVLRNMIIFASGIGGVLKRGALDEVLKTDGISDELVGVVKPIRRGLRECKRKPAATTIHSDFSVLKDKRKVRTVVRTLNDAAAGKKVSSVRLEKAQEFLVDFRVKGTFVLVFLSAS